MKRALCILVLTYYSLGSLVLPLGDLSIIPHLRELYAHCKQTEDKDLNVVDFITDHLMNIDGIFDTHKDGDEQKPHQPFDHQVSASFAFFISDPATQVSPPKEIIQQRIITPAKTYHFDFVGSVFRPPIG